MIESMIYILKYIFWFVLGAVMLLGTSWLITCGIIKLITWCFGLTFSWPIATGIWLILWLLGSIFKKS